MPSWRLGQPSKNATSGSAPQKEASKLDSALRAGNDGHYGLTPPDTPNEPPLPPLSSNAKPLKPHIRSNSQTFPLGFANYKKKHEVPPDESDVSMSTSLPNSNFPSGSSPKEIRSHKSQFEEPDFETGTCATCDSKVKWPRGISEFRCTTCQMVNDVNFPERKMPTPPSISTPQTVGSSASGAVSQTSVAETSLTLERTVSIIDQCLHSYFIAQRALHEFRRAVALKSPPTPPETELVRNAVNDTRRNSDKNSLVQAVTSSPTNRPSGLIEDSSAEKPWPEMHSTTLGELSVDLKIGASTSLSPAVTLDPLADAKERHWPSPVRRLPSPQAVPPVTQKAASQNLHHIDLYKTKFPNETTKILPSLLRKPEADIKSEEKENIFKQLEIMLAQTFGNFNCLNTSFLLPGSRTRLHPTANSEDDLLSKPSCGVSNMRHPSGGISKLDPKILLLGNVAENGSWWIGGDERPKIAPKQDRHLDNCAQLVNQKAPQIDWNGLQQWYSYIVNVGASWREDYSRLMDSTNQISFTLSESEVEEMEQDISEARFHVQKTLIRVSEALLKRPGRPLKHVDDIRFLLIVLANPMLYPSSMAKLVRERKVKLKSSNLPNLSSNGENVSGNTRRSSFRGPLRNSWERSRIFGVIKRVIGLLSNLPNDCHRHLTAWFSRLDEDHFRQLIALLESFITRRLGCQHTQRSSGSHLSTDDLIPAFSNSDAETSAQLHATLSQRHHSQRDIDAAHRVLLYSEDWQIKAAARLLTLLFSANKFFVSKNVTYIPGRVMANCSGNVFNPSSNSKRHQLLPTSYFYNTTLDYSDLVADFDAWESKRAKFSFCQYPFLISLGAKIKIMEHDARRQMSVKAREAFFSSILHNRILDQYLVLKVRRECLVEDSMKSISEVVGTGQEEIKKALKVQFINEEGIDAGGLRKEWFLLLIREIFDPSHGMFLYDEDSQFCYFNPHSFETSDQFFLVGALLGLAIYNSTILDVALPPFLFKKLLMSGQSVGGIPTFFNRAPLHLTLDDLAQYRPALATGLKKMLEYDGDVQETFCRDFVADVDCFGTITQVPLCLNGEARPVTNRNRQEFVDLYVRYLLDSAVTRQFEPFKRGFFNVCAGNALSLFQPEEIEMLIRGSDEALDISTLQSVASYQNWRKDNNEEYKNPAEELPLIRWFWETFESAIPKNQRKLLSFITGSDRIPAVGATSLTIRVCCGGTDTKRLPIARTCFNQILLYKYRSKEELAEKLWQAVAWSEGFGLK